MNIDVEISYISSVNFSMQQNHVPVVREITVRNNGEVDLKDVCVRLSFDPRFAESLELKLSSVAAGGEERINIVPVKISTSFLSSLTERIFGNMTVEVVSGENVLFSKKYDMQILAFDEWNGCVLPELLSAFVTPNHPDIIPVVKRTGEILEKWTGSPSLDAYFSRDPNRVKAQMGAVYEAIAELQITYCVHPASFENTGQRVRLCDSVMSDKLATCLDMALLYAGCLEAIGLNPIVVLVKNHAFAGGWLIPDTFPDSVNDDPALLSKRIAPGINEILLVETTCMNKGRQIDFDEASNSANYKLANTDDFMFFIDVARARHAQIRPLPLRVVKDGKFVVVEEELPERNNAAPKTLSATDIIVQNDQADVSKQIIWERKLLDLSLRNNLLNTRITRNTLQLISVHVNKLEDALADGEEFQIRPKPADWDNPLMSAGIYQSLHASDPVTKIVDEELQHKRLCAYLNDDALKLSLTHLYRSSRLSLEENGANTLYLALGLLKWFETSASKRPRFAPILLLPIEIVKRSASTGYVIRSRGEDTMLNITLLEMLRQFFDININNLDPLPRDESGVDVSLILNTVRRAIMNKTGWDVEEQAIIGNFSFSKFIMWNDIHGNADRLCKNRIIASLISGKKEWTDAPDGDETNLDELYSPEDILLPINADASQLEAIGDALNNRSFILHGPPGTGKSQTITNIIANALYRGKKVLFVAEKMAALQVVQRRLDSIGLAPFCLELHSNKTRKSSVLEQLKRTTEVMRQAANVDFHNKAGQISRLRGEMNEYVGALHKVYPAGISLYDCFSEYASCDVSTPEISLSKEFLSGLTRQGLGESFDSVSEYEAICNICGDIKEHPLRDIALTSYTAEIKAKATLLLQELSGVLGRFAKSTDDIMHLLNLQIGSPGYDKLRIVGNLCRKLLETDMLPAGMIKADNINDTIEKIRVVSSHGRERDLKRRSILRDFDGDILNADIRQWQYRLKKANSSWWLPRFIELLRLRRDVGIYSPSGRKVPADALPQLFSLLSGYKIEQEYLTEQNGFMRDATGALWNDGECDWERLEKVCSLTECLNRDIIQITRDASLGMRVKEKLCGEFENGGAIFHDLHDNMLQPFLSALDNVGNLFAELQSLLCISLDVDETGNWTEALTRRVSCWLENIDKLRNRAAYNFQRQVLLDTTGLHEIVECVENGTVAYCDISKCYRKSLFKSYAEYILSNESTLNRILGVQFENKIATFKRLCREFEKLTQKELYAKLASSLPALQQEAAQNSEVGILQRNIRNGGRGTSIRSLFDKIPGLLPRICPCMLMSPISVAQYLDMNRPLFDLVIFDEASQMPTCEAVGAIARGSNIIVVGDPKQMPPTDFFSTNTYDDSNADKEDLESILDDCLALSMPSKYLLWHYRSKHESLIAFSNVKYYENKLLTFPSPDDLATKVIYRNINGVYDRGQSRQNRAEAEAIIEEIERLLSDNKNPRQSIGVVTFNSNQQSLIEDLLNDLFRKKPHLEEAAMNCAEPVFIKNLENVQGDERDIILISVGYGPDKQGRIALNFGPLNREGGWRRLNVAVSRARYEIKIFSTLRSDQIDLNRTSAEGVAGLKAFLEYAEKGRNALPHKSDTENQTRDKLVVSIAEELKSRGYNVRTNIGCSGYKIDIGVIDPENPDKYILCIICDGYNYNMARTARDREITQFDVLKMLGWKLCRVWAMEWWENRPATIDSIIKAISDAGNDTVQDETDIVLPTAKAVSETDAANAHGTATTMGTEPTDKFRAPYNKAELGITPVPPDLLTQESYKKIITNRITAIIATEGPVSRSLLCRRLINSFGISRMGSRLNAHMERILAEAGLQTTGTKIKFYWDKGVSPLSYGIYRPDSDREALDIAPEEVAVAACKILTDQVALPKEDLLRETARLFNYTRMGDNVTESMTRGIDYAIRTGKAIESNGMIRLP